MKISKLFHWLYCIVMFLPLFVLPIFALAVRSDNNYSPISLQVEDVVTTTNTYYINQLLTNSNDILAWSSDTEPLYLNNGYISISANASENDNVFRYFNNGDILVSNGDKIYFKFDYYLVGTPDVFNFSLIGYDDRELDVELFNDSLTLSFNVVTFSNIVNVSEDLVLGDFIFDLYNEVSSASAFVKNFQLFNLTDIFGSANEPSLSECQDIFTLSYYNFGTTYDYVVTNTVTNTVTYNDTDFGSQTIYTLYNEVDKYFNYDCVFNFGDLYSWLNATFFMGQAPLGFFIFWHLLIYWLLTSLLWLIFDILMYVPSLVHRWLDKASLS